MGYNSKIEWTDATWSPVTGCSKVSQGCKYCYAERLFPRVYGRDRVITRQDVDVPRTWPTDEPITMVGIENRPRRFTDVKLHEDRLDQPLHWKRPRMVFVNSMSDLFHEDVPDEFIDKVFAVMAQTPQHTFQILTKRPERMLKYLTRSPAGIEACRRRIATIMDGMGNSKLADEVHVGDGWTAPGGTRWPLPNVWLGVSVEDQATADERIPILLQTPAAVRWVSAEPLLGPVDFEAIDTVTGAFPVFREHGYSNDNTPLRISALREGKVAPPRLDWIVVGGESGPKARPMHPDWARTIRDQCKAAGVPFFFKQWGEWAPAHPWHDTAEGTWVHTGGQTFGPVEGEMFIPVPTSAHMIRYGKKRSGAFLDGIEHKEYPEVK